MFGFNIWQIVFATIAFPILTYQGSVQFRQFEQRSFQPQTIKQQNIDQRQLSAVRDLKGTWQGTMNYTRHQPDFYSTARGTWQSGNCAYNFLLRLVINSQTDTTIAGTDSYSRQASSNICDAQDASIDSNWSAATPFKASISGSRITSFDFSFSDVFGSLSGSFTTDTITIDPGPANQISDQVFYQLDGPINLLRQK